MFSVYLCEDSEIFIDQYSEFLNIIAQKLSINLDLKTFPDGESLIAHLEETDCYPDLVFLDIIMKEMTGIDVAVKMRDMNCPSEIIFLTSTDDFFFDAFQILPFHYLMKVDAGYSSFEEIFIKAYEYIQDKTNDVFTFICDGTPITIPTYEILSFEENQSGLTTLLTEKVSYDFDERIDILAERFETKGFTKISSNALANMKHIKYIYSDHIVMTGNLELTIEPSRSSSLKLIFSNYLASQL